MINLKEFKHIKSLTVGCFILYFLLTLVGPFLVINKNYGLFVEAEDVNKLSGIGILVVLILSVVAFTSLKVLASKIPELTLNQARFKNTIILIRSLIIPFIVCFILYMLHSNFDLAYRTIRSSIIFFVLGSILEHVVISSCLWEMTVRAEKIRKNEIESR